MIEEEEAFHAYAEQRRYAATLGRSCLNSSGTPSRSSKDSDTLEKQHHHKGGLKGFSRLVQMLILFAPVSHVCHHCYLLSLFKSHEVTSYAEWTMPRNKGYAPISARGGTDSPVNQQQSVHFAKIDHSSGGTTGGSLTLSRPRPPVPPRY